MKKVFTTAALVLSACAFTMAQDASAPSDFKPAAGANNLELNFVPLNGKPIQLTYIRYRRFLSETTAFRLGIGLSYKSEKADSVFSSKIATSPAGTMVKSGYKKTEMGWNIRPGFEKHFAGTNRLSPYIGAELDLAGQSTKEITPLSNDSKDEFTVVTEKNKSKSGFFRLGINLVAGFDCYITKHLYLGTELGFGFQMVKFSDYKKETAYPSSVVIPAGTYDPNNPEPATQGSEMNIGPNFNSAIRLGFIF